ncbi:hypothetical protein AB1Y20_007790 [Prymnesium parvum]|uniref:AAA domain-containing protein n=1 Tax=Prymnesium parvum TaxID=97485 RepID=A0AB34IRX8_PRYPA
MAAPRRACTKICVYNYKGGASKTTITVNLAAALAKKGKKVLMVDLDPQCNTTQFWNPDHYDAKGEEDSTQEAATALGNMGSGEVKVESDILHPTKLNSEMEAYVNSTLKTPLYMMFDAHFNEHDITLLDQVLCDEQTVVNVNGNFFSDRLWLLKGSQLIFTFERDLSAALEDKTMGNRHVKSIGLLSFILNDLAKRHGFDVILLDVSPSNCALNQISALSCDYILPPCNASLYSCGSIYGLLTTVLPGQAGWLGFHQRLAAHQWDPAWASALSSTMLPFRLPKDPPQLLPILVTNYGMELRHTVAASSSAKRQKPSGSSMRFQPSQFVYTLEEFLRGCKHIQRDDRASASSSEAKIKFRTNHGREVIAFVPSVPVSIAATEALGRPFVEITLAQFAEFYEFNPDEMKTEQNKLKRTKMLKKMMELGLLDALDINANDVFTREVELVKKRFESLADWLVQDVMPP